MRGFVRALSLSLALSPVLPPPALRPRAGTTDRRHRGRRLFRRRLRRAQGCRPGSLQGRLPRRRQVPGLHLQHRGALVLSEERCRRAARRRRRRLRQIVAAAAEPQPDVEAERIAELTFLPQILRRRGAPLRRPACRNGDRRRRRPRRGDRRGRAQQGRPATICTALDSSTARRSPSRRTGSISGPTSPTRRSAPRATTGKCSRRWRENRTAGAINAYLRAVTPEERAYALELIGWSLADRYDWKPAIRAYRASLALVDDPTRRATYDDHARPSTAFASSTTWSRPMPPRRASA